MSLLLFLSQSVYSAIGLKNRKLNNNNDNNIIIIIIIYTIFTRLRNQKLRSEKSDIDGEVMPGPVRVLSQWSFAPSVLSGTSVG